MLKRVLRAIKRFFSFKLCLYINSNNVLPLPWMKPRKWNCF